jgi:hypothetical protein
MPKIVDHPLRKHTLNLYDGDMEELRALFPGQDSSVIVRELVRNCIREMRKREREGQPELQAGVRLP